MIKMAREITNLDKFYCFYVYCCEIRKFREFDKDCKVQEAECRYFCGKNVKAFSQIDSWSLSELQKLIRKHFGERGTPTPVFLEQALTDNLDSVPEIVKELLPVNHAQCQKLLEKKWSEQSETPPKDEFMKEHWDSCEARVRFEQYFGAAAIMEKFKEFRNKVDEELKERADNMAVELKKYNLTLDDIETETAQHAKERGKAVAKLRGALYDTKAVKRAFKRKVAEKFGFVISNKTANETDENKRAKAIRHEVTEFLKRKLASEEIDTLEDFDSLCARYISMSGCDLMNGFLRGTLELGKKKGTERKGNWGTDLELDLPTFLSVALRSLKFKYALYAKKLDVELDVFRATRVAGVQKCVENWSNKFKGHEKAVESFLNQIKKFEKGKINGEVIYMDKAVTSTTPDEVELSYHLSRNMGKTDRCVKMEIKINKNTAFGIDFKDPSVSFNDTQFNYELILKPKQKIKLTEIKENTPRIVVLIGETVS